MAVSEDGARGGRSWLATLRRYALFTLGAHLTWEAAHVPLYTIWEDGTAGEIAFAVVHCTAGDLVIASACLVAALALLGDSAWPVRQFAAVVTLATLLGLAYTVYSENRNLDNASWRYRASMPVVPALGVGLTPLLQWAVLPPFGLAWAAHRRHR